MEFDFEKSETGQVVLHQLANLKVEMFCYQPHGTPYEKEDPRLGQFGFYLVSTVSLLQSCENYWEEHFTLNWLPKEKKFAVGDVEHGHLLVFPNVTWTQISANPIAYLEAMEDGNEEEKGWYYLRPWLQHEFEPSDD